MYIFLVDEMNIALNRFLNIEDLPSVPEPLADAVQLKQFAEEAEMNGNVTLASKYHEEVCVILSILNTVILIIRSTLISNLFTFKRFNNYLHYFFIFLSNISFC